MPEKNNKTQLLLVDDDDLLRETLTMILQHGDFEVSAASNVNDALKLIGSQTFDLLLSDLHMPGLFRYRGRLAVHMRDAVIVEVVPRICRILGLLLRVQCHRSHPRRPRSGCKTSSLHSTHPFCCWGSDSATRTVASAKSAASAHCVSSAAANRFPGVRTGSEGKSRFAAMP